jgi:hypothetical protein
VLGHVAAFDVGVLGSPGQDREGLLGGHLVPLHEDALGLTDQVARRHRDAQILFVSCAAQRHGRLGGERQPLTAGLRVEAPELRGVQVQRTQAVLIGEQLQGQAAADPGLVAATDRRGRWPTCCRFRDRGGQL